MADRRCGSPHGQPTNLLLPKRNMSMTEQQFNTKGPPTKLIFREFFFKKKKKRKNLIREPPGRNLEQLIRSADSDPSIINHIDFSFALSLAVCPPLSSSFPLKISIKFPPAISAIYPIAIHSGIEAALPNQLQKKKTRRNRHKRPSLSVVGAGT